MKSKQILIYNKELCVDCGSCTGVCFTGTLTMNKPLWVLNVDYDKCSACGLCITACPFSCFKLESGS